MKDGLLCAPAGVIGAPFVLKARDRRFRRLFTETAMRPHPEVPKITTIREVSLSRRRTRNTVGLTRYSRVRYFLRTHPTQTITFYSFLLGSLSEPASVAVMAHELAHAWLNEHVVPEESKKRELEADELAREWGFSRELDALNREAETVN